MNMTNKTKNQKSHTENLDFLTIKTNLTTSLSRANKYETKMNTHKTDKDNRFTKCNPYWYNNNSNNNNKGKQGNSTTYGSANDKESRSTFLNANRK